MFNLHIQSVSAQFEWPAILELMLALVSKVVAMGLVRDQPIRVLDAALVKKIFDALQGADLVRVQRSRLESLLKSYGSGAPSPETVQALRQVVDALDESPVPDTEWRAMRDIFGDDELATLLGISLSSLRRYAAAEPEHRRNTPLRVADRLHWLAMVVAELVGSYNEFGIRRWFERPRSVLGKRSPRECLGKDWTSDSEGARQVRQLAASLSAAGAT